MSSVNITTSNSPYRGKRSPVKTNVFLYDRWLLLAIFAIVAIGLLMVTSASMVISEQQFGQPFHYVLRQATYLIIGIAGILSVIRVDTANLQRYGGILLVTSLVLLAVVLIPGIGHAVNGSRRWIGFGPVRIQVSEFAKLSVILYMAGYLVRREKEVRTQIIGFMKPMFILVIASLLLLKEPDFGAVVVIISTALGMMFLAGVRLWQFVFLLGGVACSFVVLAFSSPYRLARLSSFLNPWQNQFDSGYQLTQSLIAFGRGGWFGVGLGESIQKLFYLPEAHTDFLFAVLAEELGLIGMLVVIGLFVLLVTRAFVIARKAQLQRFYFASYTAFGIALWIGMQTMINLGVNSGVLPTKGLTLPLMSYGGSSMLVMCVTVGILLRIDYELRLEACGLITHRI